MRVLDAPPCDPFCLGPNPIVTIRMFNTGRQIKIQLDPSAAPITVAYFIQLVQEGFYDGLRFHRMAPGFVLQGGCPLGTGDGETDCYLKGEFAENGVDNPLCHTYGTISMARQEGCDTASCQFYIVLKDAPMLDGHYAAFGRVIEGFDVLESIQRIPVDMFERPKKPIAMAKVSFE